jgi:hypothetical protein
MGVVVGVRASPDTLVPALSGTVFGLVALVTDPQFGAGVMYDILALVLVQRRLWANELTYLTLVCEAVVLVQFACSGCTELGANLKEKRGVYR